LLYLYKKYAENEIERAKQAGDEWFEKDELRGVSGEVEIRPIETDERAIRKKDEGIPGEEKPASPEREIKPEEPEKPEITLDELAKQVETLEKTREKRLRERISHFTDIQQREARESIEKIKSSIEKLKTSLNEAMNDFEKTKNWLISEKEKQGEIEHILTPLKMKVQYQQAKLINLLKLLHYKRNYLYIGKR